MNGKPSRDLWEENFWKSPIKKIFSKEKAFSIGYYVGIFRTFSMNKMLSKLVLERF